MALSESYKNRMKVLSGQKQTLIESARVDFLKNEFTERISRKYDRFAKANEENRWDKHREKDTLVLHMFETGQLTRRGKVIDKQKFLKWAIEIVFNELEKADPTDNKQYLKWLVNIYLDGRLPEEDFYKIPETLTLFNKNKERLPLEGRNAHNYKDLSNMYEAVLPFSKGEEMSAAERERIVKLEGAEQVYDDEDWKIIIPKTLDAACLYGKSTRWCTASSGNNMFGHYSKQGPLYILINKKEKDERSPIKKLQFHFQTNQFMNTLDSQIKVRDFFVGNPKLKEFFKKRNEITPAFEFDHMLVTKEEGLKLLKNAHDKLGLISKKGFQFFKDLYKEMGATKEFINTILEDEAFIKGIVEQGKTKDLIRAYIDNHVEKQALAVLKKAKWLKEYILNIPEKAHLADFIEALVVLSPEAKKFAAELCKVEGLIWQSCVSQRKTAQYFQIISKKTTFGNEGMALAKKIINDPALLAKLKAAGASDSQIKLLNNFYNQPKQLKNEDAYKYFKNLLS